MTWKSREGKVPPPQFLADLVAYLERAHRVKPTRALVEKLYPFFVEEWRNGSTSRETANATCACQKGEIVPSAATAVRLHKGEVKPPRGAKRGDIFGAEALRTPGAKAPVTAAPPRVPSPPREKQVKTTLPKRKTAPLPAAPVAPPPLPASPPTPAPSPAPALPPVPAPPDTQSAALLGEIKSLLPGLAAQLRAEMAKEPKK